MSKAYEFKYKWHDDNRPLGPPHERFSDMHPERDMPVKNEVFLEIPKASILGVGLPALAGVFIYVPILCFFSDILTWSFIMVKTPIIWAMIGIGGVKKGSKRGQIRS